MVGTVLAMRKDLSLDTCKKLGMGQSWVLRVLESPPLPLLVILMIIGRKVKISYANVITKLKSDNTAIGYFLSQDDPKSAFKVDISKSVR